jgi:hypothetical protein
MTKKRNKRVYVMIDILSFNIQIALSKDEVAEISGASRNTICNFTGKRVFGNYIVAECII